MIYCFLLCFVMITQIASIPIDSQLNEKEDLLEWYYKQEISSNQLNLNLPRNKRQIRGRNDQISRQFGGNSFDYDNSDGDDDDDWYVFDSVEESDNRNQNNRPSFTQNNNRPPFIQNNNRPPFIQNNNRPSFSQNNNQNQRPQFWSNNNRPTTIRPVVTTAAIPIIPNGGPPRLSQCEENCNARTTAQYNPVCGTNGLTYFNNARFECARSCGQNINVRNLGRCGPLLPRT